MGVLDEVLQHAHSPFRLPTTKAIKLTAKQTAANACHNFSSEMRNRDCERDSLSPSRGAKD